MAGAVRKYRNVPTEVDGVKFDSKAEARRFGELRLMEKAGVISGLALQPKFDLCVNGKLVCRYRGDFAYVEAGAPVIEDVKGIRTPAFNIKAKLMKACHGIEIRVVK